MLSFLVKPSVEACSSSEGDGTATINHTTECFAALRTSCAGARSKLTIRNGSDVSKLDKARNFHVRIPIVSPPAARRP